MASKASTPATHANRARRHNRRGLTLLETILAIAILGMCMAIVGELIRVGARHASTARDLTTAQILCESYLNEIAAGVIQPAATSNEPCEFDPEWHYSIVVDQAAQTGVIVVEVTVTRVDDPSSRPIACKLTRWMPDPETTAAAQDASASGGAL